MKSSITGDDGLALLEQLLALLLGAIVLSSLYAYYRVGLYQVLAQETKAAALQDARGALDIFVRDVRNAGSWGSGVVPTEHGSGDDPDADADTVCNRVYAASATVFHAQMDLNGNENCSDSDPRENVRYEIGGATATCPGAKVIRRNGECLVANVKTPSGKLFTYYDDAGSDLGTAPSLSSIKRVRIAFAVEEKNPDARVGGTVTASLTTSVELRN